MVEPDSFVQVVKWANGETMWRPIPPAGYIAMGLVASKTNNPPGASTVKCIKKDYTQRGYFNTDVSKDRLWYSEYTGANSKFSIWEVYPPEIEEGTPTVHFHPNTFAGNTAAYSSPGIAEENSNAYVLKLDLHEDMPENANTINNKPQLTSFDLPELNHPGTTSYAYLPWFLVIDIKYTTIDKIKYSPIYKLERQTDYLREYFHHVDGGSPFVVKFETSQGTNVSKMKEWNTETNITVTGKIKGAGYEASASISHTMSHGGQDSKSWDEKKTITEETEIKANHAMAVYVITSKYTLLRMSGVPVYSSTLSCKVADSKYTTTYPNTAGIKNTELNKLFKIYPTQSSGKFTIDLNGPYVSSMQELRVINLQGRLVHTQHIGTNKTVIDLTGNSAGMYFVKLTDGKTLSTQKITLR